MATTLPVWREALRDLSVATVRVRTWEPRGEPQATVVLAHGLGGSVLDWDLLAPRIAQTHRVVAFDFPGFGLSGPSPDGTYGIEAQVAALAEMVESEAAAADGTVHVIGNSMGGLVAINLAAYAPDPVRTLALLSPALPDRTPRLTHLPMLLFGSRRVGPAFFEWYLKLPRERQLAEKVEVSFAGKPAPDEWLAASDDLLDHLQQSDTIATAYASAANDLLRMATDRSPDRAWELVKRLQVPVLVTHSGRDQLVNPETRYLWAKALPTSQRVLLLDAGHVAQLSSPGIVERTWRGFVAAAATGGSGTA